MPDTVSLTLRLANGLSYEMTEGFSFRFFKERYTPFTSVSVRANNRFQTSYGAKTAELRINNNLIHCGIIDTLNFVREGGVDRIELESKGYSSLLTQNQMTPGLVSNITLSNLVNDYYSVPNISCENDSAVANYIYCNDGSTMWDAIANLGQKLHDTYPYIRGTNTVMISQPSAPASIVVPQQVFSLGTRFDYRKIISDFHMQDINGSYDVYNSTNVAAVSKGIVRHREIPLDRQHLNDPSISLGHKTKFCMRGFYSKFVEYEGYCGEDLCDKVSFESHLSSDEISLIEIRGNGRFIKTKVYAYFDEYCNL